MDDSQRTEASAVRIHEAPLDRASGALDAPEGAVTGATTAATPVARPPAADPAP